MGGRSKPHSKTSLNRPTMGLTFNGPFREAVRLRSYNIYSGVVDLWMWSVREVLLYVFLLTEQSDSWLVGWRRREGENSRHSVNIKEVKVVK